MNNIPQILIRAGLIIIIGLGALFILLYVFTIGDHTVAKTVEQDPSIPHITIKGVTFHAQTFGDPKNPVVIVIHGGPGWDYRSLLNLNNLSDEYFVVFYDQRGTGLSPRVNQDELTLESTLEDLDSVIDYYSKGKKVNIVGHSWGAMLASAYIGQHPEKIDHAVLAEPGFLTTEMLKESGVSMGPRFEFNFLYHAAIAWFESLHVQGPDKYASSDYFMGKITIISNPEYYCNGIKPEKGSDNWRASSQALNGIIRSGLNPRGEFEINLTEGVDRFTNKVLFIASECNTKTGVKHQKKQMKFFPDAEIAVINDSGHGMFAEQPEESIRIIRNYLNTPQ